METEICRFSINISQWNIICNKVISEQDWILGEQHWREKSADWESFSPKLAFLPPIKRRRLSDSARLFFEVAWNLVGENADIPVVYSSNNGEINRNFELWQSLLQQGDISPTSFSLSVHNALVGQWSEFRQVKNEITAISAKDNLETALLEAHLLLNEGYKQVLVVIAESPVYAKYNVAPVEREPFSYALAMLVESGGQYSLKLTEKSTALLAESDINSPLTWVKNQYLHCNEWKVAANRGIWLWRKN